MSLKSLAKIVLKCAKKNIRISDYVLEDQMELLECGKQEILDKMADTLKVMKEAGSRGIQEKQNSFSGLTQADAYRYSQYLENNSLPGGKLFNNIIAKALAVSEVNACMGRIVAAPTAGSCGVLPALLISLQEEYDFSDVDMIDALLTSSGVGAVIAYRATLSGAEGGCQAEVGSASGMAAAAAVQLMGGTPEACANACAMALKNTLGLVCDPVAGLVEVPCVKRNVMGAVNALSSANLALAGIKSAIPVDEVIDAMGDIGSQIHSSLRETAEGGLAATPTGRKLYEEYKEKAKH